MLPPPSPSWTCLALSDALLPPSPQVDVSRPGLDLLGRDVLLLGRLLATLAAFSEHAAGSAAATPLACATLELLRSPQVGDSSLIVWRC